MFHCAYFSMLSQSFFRAGETVALLLSHRAISPNGVYPPGSGTTPLHLAASLGRADVANLLLEQDEIDDSLRDINGKTCRDVAKGKDVIAVIDGM
jgi:ankyrin repeat protein